MLSFGLAHYSMSEFELLAEELLMSDSMIRVSDGSYDAWKNYSSYRHAGSLYFHASSLDISLINLHNIITCLSLLACRGEIIPVFSFSCYELIILDIYSITDCLALL